MSAPVQSEAARITYRSDRLRAPFYGILEAGWTAFGLVVAIRYFAAPETFKAFIAGAGPMGFLLTPLTLYLAARVRLRPSIACGLVFLASAVFMVGATLAQSLLFFVLFLILSQMAAVQQGTLMLHIYAENYQPHERGARLTTPLILIALSSIGFSLFGGWLLDLDLELYRIIFATMGIAAAAAAWFVHNIPTAPLSTEHIGHPLQSLSLIWKDRFFGFLLGSWMLLGLGNLITMPIRVEYLANPAYGINADNTTIATLLLVVPSTCRILSTKIWGRVFDRLHLITTRNLLNLCFLLSIALFFFSRNLVLLTLGMAFVGFAMGGGKIIWSLWVTRIAPPEKASSYMSVHMAMTGLRGTLAPFLGYWILSGSSPQVVAGAGLTLIVISTLLFHSVRGHGRLSRT